MSSAKDSTPIETKDNSKSQMHTYTHQSNEELQWTLSKNTIKDIDLKGLKRENEYLKRELNNSKQQLKRLIKKVTTLENKRKRPSKVGGKSIPFTLPKSKSYIESKIEIESDEEYVKSWEVLGHHFSEVIRRHHEVLAEKDRQIKELQVHKYYMRDISNNMLGSSKKGNSSKINKTISSGYPNSFISFCEEARLKDINEAGPSTKYKCEDQCNCMSICAKESTLSTKHQYEDQYNSMPVNGEYCSIIYSGEMLSEHFSEVIRRHKQQLQEKDCQIQELQEALECCLGQKHPPKHQNDSEVQIRYHDYHKQSQPPVWEHEPMSASSGRLPDTQTRVRVLGQTESSDAWLSTIQQTPTSSSTSEEEEEEEDNSLVGSADTFVAIEKCQRLESIANLETLRQNLIQRLELEEKLDKLYWQTELNRYRELRDDAGDSFDPDSMYIKDFELLETTRLELLRALKDLKESANREPEIYVDSHLPIIDSESMVKNQAESPERENKRRVTITEEVTVTTVQTTYED